MTPWPHGSGEVRAMGTSRGESTMPTMRCGVAAVEALRAVGVTTIFGLMGSSTLEIYDALYDATDITYTGVRHENCGAQLPQRRSATTRLGRCMACSLPGARQESKPGMRAPMHRESLRARIATVAQ